MGLVGQTVQKNHLGVYGQFLYGKMTFGWFYYASRMVQINRTGSPTAHLPKNVRQQKHKFKLVQHDDLTRTLTLYWFCHIFSQDSVGCVNCRSGKAAQYYVRIPKTACPIWKMLILDRMLCWNKETWTNIRVAKFVLFTFAAWREANTTNTSRSGQDHSCYCTT